MSERATLAASFTDVGGAVGVFTSKASDYASARPDYPGSLYAELEGQMSCGRPLDVVDIGAGTGLLTQGWLRRGHAVVAVEPNDAMRATCDALLRGDPRYSSMSGRAEATDLADASVDLVTAAQAFHWFDPPAFRAECLRILRPKGRVALIWNDRGDDPLNNALTAIFVKFGGAKRTALAASNVKNENITQFFGSGAVHEWSTVHSQALDASGLAALAFSRSFMPPANSPAGIAARQDLDALFSAHAADGWVHVPYRTLLFLGRPEDA